MDGWKEKTELLIIRVGAWALVKGIGDQHI